MILTTQTDYIGRTHGDLAAVEILADAGFDALDYTMFSMRDDDCLLNTDAYKSHITALKAAADRRGIPFRQAHAPRIRKRLSPAPAPARASLPIGWIPSPTIPSPPASTSGIAGCTALTPPK